MENNKKTIFLVDDDLVILSMGSEVLSEKYNVYTVNSGARLLQILDRHIPDLILLDIEMPIVNGYDTIRRLKERNGTKDIPVIFLTAKSDSDNELKGLSLGAIDYISKPFIIPLLLKRIELHMLVESQKKELESQKSELISFNNNLKGLVEKKTNAIVELQNAVLNTFAELVEYRDRITGGHIGRAQEYMHILIKEMHKFEKYAGLIDTWDMPLILLSAQLHDIGKIAIRDNILLKPGKLTSEEYDVIKTHVAYGVHVIDKIMSDTTEKSFLEQARIMVSTHHEKWNGSGYPNGMKGQDIPLQGRIMALVDVYDALISDRPYKGAYPHEKAVEIITGEKGAHFDPELVDLFMEVNWEFKAIAMTHNRAPNSIMFPERPYMDMAVL